MLRSDNPHAIRLYESIKKHAGAEAAERLLLEYPLSKSAGWEKKSVWAETVCAALEREFDPEIVLAVRMDCACGPDAGKVKELRRLYQSSLSLEDFAAKMNRLNKGFTVELDGSDFFLIYPCCYCSCVKRGEKQISRTWCYCTLGYTKKMFGQVFDRDVQVELMESVKTGGSRCKIRIR